MPGGWARRRSPRVQPDVVVIPTRGQERQLITDAAGDAEAEHVAVEGEGAVEVGHLEVDVADLRAGIDRVMPTTSRTPARHIGVTPETTHLRGLTPLLDFSRVEQLEERDGEIAAVERVLAGGGGLLIEGPPGIGKTRLLGVARSLAGGRLGAERSRVGARARLPVRGGAAVARAGGAG